MRCSLAVDSGGSKVQAILYDEKFRPLKSCRVGSMRLNTTPEDVVKSNAGQLIKELEIDGTELECVNGIFEDTLADMLNARCRVQEFKKESEAHLGFCAAGVFRDGCLAVAGTGATMFVRKGNAEYSSGGYGSSLADEGSGYWIGKEGMMAAVRDYEDRGPKTLLTDLIAEHMGGSRKTFRERIFEYVYREQKGTSPVSHAAYLCRLVSQAAGDGDQVAAEILKSAGKVLGEQAVSLMKKHMMPMDAPVALSGSVWKADRILAETFQSTLYALGAQGNVFRPVFEPIVGSVISHHVRLHGAFSAWDIGYFRTHYNAFLYDKR